jgi:hypothetical protein
MGGGILAKRWLKEKKTFKRYTTIHTLTFLTYLSRGCPKKSYNTIAAFSLSPVSQLRRHDTRGVRRRWRGLTTHYKVWLAGALRVCECYAASELCRLERFLSLLPTRAAAVEQHGSSVFRRSSVLWRRCPGPASSRPAARGGWSTPSSPGPPTLLHPL